MPGKDSTEPYKRDPDAEKEALKAELDSEQLTEGILETKIQGDEIEEEKE
ncbi:MAG: hypothetical protein OEV93_04785 [Candidatus Moranbacteria bacterium]|nr:hypothetical protein [Candidatus Moranbacteria bacterium]